MGLGESTLRTEGVVDGVGVVVFLVVVVVTTVVNFAFGTGPCVVGFVLIVKGAFVVGFGLVVTGACVVLTVTGARVVLIGTGGCVVLIVTGACVVLTGTGGAFVVGFVLIGTGVAGGFWRDGVGLVVGMGLAVTGPFLVIAALVIGVVTCFVVGAAGLSGII